MVDNPNVPCIHITDSNLDKICVDTLVNLPYTHDFKISNRKALYFGSTSYSYGQITHPPNCISNYSIVENIFNMVCGMFPALTFNSVLVHLYPGAESFLPIHSDDEKGIVSSSWILSVSLGASIIFNMYDRVRDTTHNIILKHGDLLLMSKASQKRFKHGFRHGFEPSGHDINKDPIISTSSKSKHEVRVSLTFRNMN